MKNKEKFIAMLNTQFWSWGGDPPAEAFWAANELLDWVESQFEVELGVRFDEENMDNFDKVVDAIKEKL